MKVCLSAPSKTYLTGEYAVLAGGPALVLNTTPRFELHASKTGPVEAAGKIRGIPAGSPAAEWLRQRSPLLEDWSLEFVDPHGRRGGFGASGAQFILVHAFTTLLQSSMKPKFVPGDMFNDYRVCSASTGSGADVLAQIAGGVASVDMQELRAKSQDWPYPEMGFAVVRTGTKIATHLHLQNLDTGLLNHLIDPAKDAALSFGKVSAQEFADNVNTFTAVLRRLNLQNQRTLRLLEPFQRQPWCLAAKGCGAWGADTILLLFPKAAEVEAAAFAEEQGMPFAATELSGGLDVKGT